MKDWEYIIVQAYSTEERSDIGTVSVFVEEQRPNTVKEASIIMHDWRDKGYSVSCAGKIRGEAGERMITDID